MRMGARSLPADGLCPRAYASISRSGREARDLYPDP